MNKFCILIFVFIFPYSGCNIGENPCPPFRLIKYSNPEYNNYVTVNVKDSIIVSYPDGYDRNDSVGCILFENNYFLGSCTFGSAEYGILLNVLKSNWLDFLQNVVWQDSQFFHNTWQEYVLDYTPFEEVWRSTNYVLEDSLDYINLNKIILNGTLSEYFERIF